MPNKSIGWLVCCIIEFEQTMHGMKCMLCAIQHKYAHIQHERTWKSEKKTKKKTPKFITKTASVLQISQIVFKHFSSPNGIRVWIFQLKCVWMPWKNGSYSINVMATTAKVSPHLNSTNTNYTFYTYFGEWLCWSKAESRAIFWTEKNICPVINSQ